MNYPDSYDLWEQHERKMDRQLERLPRCSECDEPIQDDHFYLVNGENICEQCLYDNYRKAVEDYID